MTKIHVYSSEGKSVKEIELPAVFTHDYREDLIKRAVLSDESKEYQPQGHYKYAGLETSAKYVGRKEVYGSRKNKGISHLPHEVQPKGQFGKVKRVPHAVKGRRAHPPKPEKKLVEAVNKKEYNKAFISALSASANKELVNRRHLFSFDSSLPIIVDKSAEELKKTEDVIKMLDALKLGALMGKSKLTGSKGALIVTGGNLLSAGRNIAGVETVSADALKVKHLAPGTHAGRLLVISESELAKLSERLSK